MVIYWYSQKQAGINKEHYDGVNRVIDQLSGIEAEYTECCRFPNERNPDYSPNWDDAKIVAVSDTIDAITFVHTPKHHIDYEYMDYDDYGDEK